MVIKSISRAADDPGERRWVDYLDAEDLAFLKRFALASGSLKDTAAAYGVSYPTVRLRLDRLIAKIQVIDSNTSHDELELLLRAAHADGKLDLDTMRVLLAAYRQKLER